MGKYFYSNEEEKILKVIRMNRDDSEDLLSDKGIKTSRNNADDAINSSTKLLQSLGYGKELSDVRPSGKHENTTKIDIRDFTELSTEADKRYESVEIEDLLSAKEFQEAYDDLDRINAEFSKKTSIINKTDITFLAIATALQVAKALVEPTIAGKFDYGKSFDASKRLDHNDKSIEKAHRDANDKFRDQHSKKHENGTWVNLLYQTPAYDITAGSPNINFNMEGRYHRLHTLGHDPILGWIFGTANILTDIITLNDFSSYRVIRKPKMRITPECVSMLSLFNESFDMVKDDMLNLPAALFAQAQHLKSDVNTKQGLPLPVLETFAENFAGKLYKNQYDALCFSRDLKIIGVSAAVTMIFDMIIGLIHGLFYCEENDESRDLYEVRTRKILLISNSIASTSSIIYACATSNPKNLDIGGLLVTIAHLFSDVRFVARIKKEFVEKELNKQLQAELDVIDSMVAEFE